MGPLVVIVALVALALLVSALERRRPAGPARSWSRWRELPYWLLTPLVSRIVTRTAIVLAAVVLALALGVPLATDALRAHYEAPTWLDSLPAPLAALLVLLVADLVGYWAHRAFHRGWLWRVHAVHHASERLDWLAAVRVHPLDDLLGGVIRAIPLLALGVRPGTLGVLVPLLTLHAILLHANVRWDYGPLRYVIASPAFHRWHHAKSERSVNYAGLFPFLDLLFGTYHCPPGELPQETGVAGEDPVPDGFLAQLAYPLRPTDHTTPPRH